MANDKLRKLAAEIVEDWEDWWVSGEGRAEATFDPDNPDKVDIQLLDDEGEDFTIGSFAEPGMTVEWIGECMIADEDISPIHTPPLVKVNGIFMQAASRHIVGWALGCEE
jgi:hypothetical protein